MKSLSIKSIVKHLDGEIVNGSDNLIINDIVTRTRNLRHGFLLFDIYDNFDNKIIKKLNNPTCAVVSDKPLLEEVADSITFVKVDNIDSAFWKFVDYYRSLFDIPVIGVTGTCGKTTTKEMIAYILSYDRKVNSTYKSLNAGYRHFGYLLEVNDDTDAGVFEMGVSLPGDLINCCRYFKPQIGVITNIGVDHLQGFRTLDDYIKGKAEFIEGLDYKGTLIINADDENIKKIDFGKYKGKIIKFGFDKNSDYVISDVKIEKGGLVYKLQFENQFLRCTVPLYAEYNAYNATAAIAAVHSLGIDLNKAAERLASFKNVEKHFEIHKGINQSIIIDDTWSTNPTSAEIALKQLKNLAQGKKTVAVLGKMSLLGSKSTEYHKKIGGIAALIPMDYLILMGERARNIGLGAIENGMQEDRIYYCNNSDEAFEVLNKILDDKSIALIKTSMMESYNDLIEKLILTEKEV